MATLGATIPRSVEPTSAGLVPVHLLALPGSCWRCGREVLPLVGVLVPGARGATRFIEFAAVVERLRVVVPPARLRTLGIGPIRLRTTRLRPEGYLANACVHCDAVLGEHPLREDLTTFLAEGGGLAELSIGQVLLQRRARPAVEPS